MDKSPLSPTPKPPKTRILVADDEKDLLTLLKEALESEGYEVTIASNGQEALNLIRAKPPDIAVIDLFMPIKDGFAVCRELKQDPDLQYLPLIIFSASSGRDNKIHGLDLGANDFLTKPVDLAELLARIRMIVKRTRQELDANPLTHLPGNSSIEARISDAINSQSPLAVLYVDLNMFKAYNDAYGFDAGDRVIKATARLLVKIAKEYGKNKDFIGHIGGDDFILVTDPERMEPICQAIVSEFDCLAPSFYNEEDRKRGKIIALDRKGNPMEYPLLSIAIGVCHNKIKRLSSYGQVSQIGSELKKFAKQVAGSHYIIDRRKD